MWLEPGTQPPETHARTGLNKTQPRLMTCPRYQVPRICGASRRTVTVIIVLQAGHGSGISLAYNMEISGGTWRRQPQTMCSSLRSLITLYRYPRLRPSLPYSIKVRYYRHRRRLGG